MLSFVQSWFAAGANPVGVDFGAQTLRLAQIDRSTGDHRLIAAASMDVPESVRNDSAERLTFFTSALRELWSRGNFRGRRAMLGLPASSMHIQHLRLPKMDEASLCKAIPWELEGKLPINSATALIRHIVAGEIYHEHQPANEVIVLAAEHEAVEQLLAAAARARLDIAGLNVEPRAMIDCFLNVYRRRTDAAVTNFFIDIGSSGTRAAIARGGKILFARAIPIGGEQFNQAVADDLGMTAADARQLRINLVDDEVSGSLVRSEFAIEAIPAPPAQQSVNEECLPQHVASQTQTMLRAADAASIEQAIAAPLERLVEELALCRRYYEATFPDQSAQRLIFVGGEARQRGLCTTIARRLGIAAQVGDPMVRMARTTEVGIESGIDRRLPQPGWAVAIGLSMGTPGVDPANGSLS